MIHAPRSFALACAACLLVAAGGCAPRVGADRPAPHKPTPHVADPIADAAEQALRDYVAGLAKTARETAEAAPTFKAHADAADYGAKKNKAARDKSFRPAFREIDAFALQRDQKTGKAQPYNAERTAKALRSFADGIERPIKTSPWPVRP